MGEVLRWSMQLHVSIGVTTISVEVSLLTGMHAMVIFRFEMYSNAWKLAKCCTGTCTCNKFSLDLPIYKTITIIINDDYCYYWYDFKSLSDHWPVKRAECNRKHFASTVYIGPLYSMLVVHVKQIKYSSKLSGENIRPGNT